MARTAAARRTTQRTTDVVRVRYASARRAFRSDAELAEWLGVHRSRVTRWMKGEVPDADTTTLLLGVDVVVSLLTDFLDESAVPDWLFGVNAHLGDRRPIDVLRGGRLADVVAAVEAERVGSFA